MRIEKLNKSPRPRRTTAAVWFGGLGLVLGISLGMLFASAPRGTDVTSPGANTLDQLRQQLVVLRWRA